LFVESCEPIPYCGGGVNDLESVAVTVDLMHIFLYDSTPQGAAAHIAAQSAASLTASFSANKLRRSLTNSAGVAAAGGTVSPPVLGGSSRYPIYLSIGTLQSYVFSTFCSKITEEKSTRTYHSQTANNDTASVMRQMVDNGFVHDVVFNIQLLEETAGRFQCGSCCSLLNFMSYVCYSAIQQAYPEDQRQADCPEDAQCAHR